MSAQSKPHTPWEVLIVWETLEIEDDMEIGIQVKSACKTHMLLENVDRNQMAALLGICLK